MATIEQPVVERRFEHLVLDFLAYLEFERGLSRNTLDAYRTDLLQFGALPGERDLSALDAEARDIADFLDRRSGRGRRRERAAAGLARHDPSQDAPACARSTGTCAATGCSTPIPPPRSARRAGRASCPQVLTRGEVEKLLSQPRGTDPASLRDRALLELMYACGLRASEAIGLELVDVDIEEGVLRARGKGSKERVVPIGQAALRALRIYLERGRPKLVEGRAGAAPVRELPRRPASRGRASTRSSAGTRSRRGSRTG